MVAADGAPPLKPVTDALASRSEVKNSVDGDLRFRGVGKISEGRSREEHFRPEQRRS